MFIELPLWHKSNQIVENIIKKNNQSNNYKFDNKDKNYEK